MRTRCKNWSLFLSRSPSWARSPMLCVLFNSFSFLFYTKRGNILHTDTKGAQVRRPHTNRRANTPAQSGQLKLMDSGRAK